MGRALNVLWNARRLTVFLRMPEQLLVTPVGALAITMLIPVVVVILA